VVKPFGVEGQTTAGKLEENFPSVDAKSAAFESSRTKAKMDARANGRLNFMPAPNLRFHGGVFPPEGPKLRR
jgi:hypothetical protein